MTSDRDIGRLEAQVEALQQRLDVLEPKLDQLLTFMDRSKGSWAAIVVIGSVSAALGSAGTWFVQHLLTWPPK